MELNNLQNYYPDLVKKYPFLKEFIKNNDHTELAQKNHPETATSMPTQETTTDSFKRRCLLSLLLKKEINQNSHSTEKENKALEL